MKTIEGQGERPAQHVPIMNNDLELLTRPMRTIRITHDKFHLVPKSRAILVPSLLICDLIRRDLRIGASLTFCRRS